MNTFSNKAADTPLVFPRLRAVYDAMGPWADLWLRVIAGVALMTHGWPKIQNPLGAVGMVEGLGFHPGWLWSPALAATEFLGGLLIALGFLTRPAAAAATVVLLVTVYFHWIVRGEGYDGAELSLIWSAITLRFALRGAGPMSVDRAIGRQI